MIQFPNLDREKEGDMIYFFTIYNSFALMLIKLNSYELIKSMQKIKSLSLSTDTI